MSIFLFLSGMCFGICIGLTGPDIYRRYIQQPVILRSIPKDEAKELISEYLKNNDGKYTSDVIFDLRLSVDLVLECLRELSDEGIIEGKNL